jgi:hypothetical protein
MISNEKHNYIRRLRINPSNIHIGGDITHLKVLLDNIKPGSFGIEKVIVSYGIKELNKSINQVCDLKISHS